MNTRDDLLTRDDVLDLLTVTRTTLYRMMKSDGFPLPIKIGEQSLRWNRGEIDAWLEHKPRAQYPVAHDPAEIRAG